MKKVFIDGSAGTTGLRIKERLSLRKDIKLISLPEELRKNDKARSEALNDADIVFLCLPDDAAMEAVKMVKNPKTCIIDTSTAHRTAENWTYGFAELHGQREKIISSKRIANPGCHASGFIALVAPLVKYNIIEEDSDLCCFSLTGYSGGGKKMIEEYESSQRDALLDAPRMYGLNQNHKHLPEMKAVCNLLKSPIFCPIVAPYYSGMQVTIPIARRMTNASLNEIMQAYEDYYYNSKVIRFLDMSNQGSFMSACALKGRDDMIVSAIGNKERITLVSVFDNLGKGASGSAIQNMNLLLGVKETEGLNIGEEL